MLFFGLHIGLHNMRILLRKTRDSGVKTGLTKALVLKKKNSCKLFTYKSFNQCSKRDSNPHRRFCPRDFKSLVSTIPPFELRRMEKAERNRGLLCFWVSGKRDSNSRPQPWQGCALPTELFPQCGNLPFSKFSLC